MQDYSPAVRYQELIKVLLIAQADQIGVYFNNQPAGYVKDSTFPDGENLLIFNGGGVLNCYVIDNLYFWKLPEDLAHTASPAWVASFVQPL